MKNLKSKKLKKFLTFYFSTNSYNQISRFTHCDNTQVDFHNYGYDIRISIPVKRLVKQLERHLRQKI